MPNPQIDMETPKIKSVPELVDAIDDAIHEASGDYISYSAENKVKAVITQDRASLHTSLVAAVEGKKEDAIKHPAQYLGDPRRSEGHNTGYNQALDDTLTIINSIFKE